MKIPQRGTIVSYSAADGVGRIRAEDGTELRFGASVLKGALPVVGTALEIRQVGPHPLGGLRAIEVLPLPDDLSSKRSEEYLRRAERERQSWGGLPQLGNVQPDPLTPEEQEALAEHKRRQEQARIDSERKQELRRAELRHVAEIFDQRGTPREIWSTLLAEQGLSESQVDQAIALGRPAARLVVHPVGSLKGSRSTLGGSASLPAGLAWPDNGGRPLAHLAVLHMPEIPAAMRAALHLPNHGCLSFFYDSEEQPWGFDPAHRSGARIVYVPEPDAAIPNEMPETFSAFSIQFVEELLLPGVESPVLGQLGRDRTFADPYLEACALYTEAHGEPRHLLGGHAETIQGSMEEECALTSHGIYTGDLVDRSRADLVPYLAEAADWRLLLQIDSDEKPGFEWGDGGRLYFWMREQDLEDRAFDRAWCVLQCY